MVTVRGPRPVDKHVGERIRMRRIMCDLTQVELADKLGITFQQVQKYENGTNRIGAITLRKSWACRLRFSLRIYRDQKTAPDRPVCRTTL